MSKYDPIDVRLTGADLAGGWVLWVIGILGLIVWCEIGAAFTV